MVSWIVRSLCFQRIASSIPGRAVHACHRPTDERSSSSAADPQSFSFGLSLIDNWAIFRPPSNHALAATPSSPETTTAAPGIIVHWGSSEPWKPHNHGTPYSRTPTTPHPHTPVTPYPLGPNVPWLYAGRCVMIEPSAREAIAKSQFLGFFSWARPVL